MRKIFFPGTVLLAASLFVLATSCNKEVICEEAEDNVSSQTAKKQDVSSSGARKTSDEQLLQSVKNATSRFHSTTQATRAEYIPSDECVSVPGLGGMGFHWVNPKLVDGVYDPLKPEAVLYARNTDGSLKLVALEYIVLSTGQNTKPMFGSQPFDNGGVPSLPAHWSLHVWLYEENPTGMFKPFNPNVSCQ